jgi:hypothetical protein
MDEAETSTPLKVPPWKAIFSMIGSLLAASVGVTIHLNAP